MLFEKCAVIGVCALHLHLRWRTESNILTNKEHTAVHHHYNHHLTHHREHYIQMSLHLHGGSREGVLCMVRHVAKWVKTRAVVEVRGDTNQPALEGCSEESRLGGWERQVAGEYKWVGRKPSGGGRGGRMCGRARQVLAGGWEDDQVLD